MSPLWRRSRSKETQEHARAQPGDARTQRLTLVLGDHNAEVLAALSRAFETASSARLAKGDLLRERVDAFISPGNSFGDMGGGFDRALDKHFDCRAQAAARAAIATHALGELPVGSALIVQVTAARPYLVVAPTMRVPGPVRGSLNAYLALRAALVAILQHNATCSPGGRIEAVGATGLCTGVGAMAATESAQQMRAAYDAILQENWRRVMHPAQAPFAIPRSPTDA